ncbi:PIG-L family deacetylase [Aneurinibacillus sp. Ricciae_BoGa-3]|uniref:PIG-L family deacetylase n=1 Tax=Aneurinibacillus sp. Ricciae_BoGa-3 TaxID=3022697 RepID=UPI002340EB54|nr:PIG-L family deacetylase [Aneurinibacillus sp. Ricciae_BoGa-3]WCK55278.1 PIG-L family deacetylase [Aneurinibacillus sp. Ricciae_BoGa-3]
MTVNKLMIVAHPDDEMIFGGNELLMEDGWKVICVTNRDNPVRSKEFSRAMEMVGAEYEMWNYEDGWTHHINRPEIQRDLERAVNERKYERIVTHNLRGEYGHPEHQALAEIMEKIVKDNLYMFDQSLDEILPLSILKKILEVSEVYKSQLHAFEQLSRFLVRSRAVRIR